MAIYSIGGSELSAAYNKDGTSLQYAYNVQGVDVFSQQTVAPDFLETAELTPLTAITPPSYITSYQGACTDGTYIYQALHGRNSIMKYKLSDGTWTEHSLSSVASIGHANDMTYNPNNGKIYIATNSTDGTILEIDSSTMEYTRAYVAVDSDASPVTLWQLFYDRTTNRFYVGENSNTYKIYDSSFHYIKTETYADRIEATSQGDETDGTFIYRLFYNPDRIQVLSKQTKEQIALIALPRIAEPESIPYDWNGNWFATYNAQGGSIFYRAVLENQTEE